jgi:hypothetical protein
MWGQRNNSSSNSGCQANSISRRLLHVLLPDHTLCHSISTVLFKNFKIGSIGIIWVFQNMYVAYETNETDYHNVNSREMKDMGSPLRGLTNKEKEYANTVVKEIYDEFISEVSRGRNLSRSD